MEEIDMDQEAWKSIKKAASESPWIPEQYFMNDWVADVISFLLKPPNTQMQMDGEGCEYCVGLHYWQNPVPPCLNCGREIPHH